MVGQGVGWRPQNVSEGVWSMLVNWLCGNRPATWISREHELGPRKFRKLSDSEWKAGCKVQMSGPMGGVLDSVRLTKVA